MFIASLFIAICDAPLEHVLLGGVLDFVCLSLSCKTLLSTAYRLLTDCYVKVFKKGEVIPLPSYCVGRGGCVVHPYFDADVRMEVRRGTASHGMHLHACMHACTFIHHGQTIDDDDR